MIDLSRTQDEEVGDGATSVIVLAGEMLRVAEAFIDKKYHTTVIFRAYDKALEDALAVLDKISLTIDVKDRFMQMRGIYYQLDRIMLSYSVVQGQAEKEFGVEVEPIGRVRHKNLVGSISVVG